MYIDTKLLLTTVCYWVLFS